MNSTDMSPLDTTTTRPCVPIEHFNLKLMSPFDTILYQIVFPVQFLVTVVGNLLTMSVLLGPHMRNRANHMLAVLALCDMVVVSSMSLHFFASFDAVAEWNTFRLLYFSTKAHIAATTNWFSAAAIWFVLAVSIERLLIIKFPFRSLRAYKTKQVALLAVGIFLFTFALTCYHHVSHECLQRMKASCNNTQHLLVFCFPNSKPWRIGNFSNPHSEFFRSCLHYSTIANALLGVILPIFAVALINISLLRLLKLRHSQEMILQNANAEHLQEQERRMTTTVVAIVSCFTLTQGPSALLFLYDLLVAPPSHYLSSITNSLVLTGKMLNVVLFCLTSSSFRRKLCATLRFWIACVTCDESKTLLRTMSRSGITQKTSVIMASPMSRAASTRGTVTSNRRRISSLSAADSFCMKQLRKADTDLSLISPTNS